MIAERGLPGSDEHFATMAQCATVSQLRTALKMQPKPTPEPEPVDEADDEDDDGEVVVDPGPQVSITSTSDERYTYWHIALPHVENAAFEPRWRRTATHSSPSGRPSTLTGGRRCPAPLRRSCG